MLYHKQEWLCDKTNTLAWQNCERYQPFCKSDKWIYFKTITTTTQNRSYYNNIASRASVIDAPSTNFVAAVDAANTMATHHVTSSTTAATATASIVAALAPNFVATTTNTTVAIFAAVRDSQIGSILKCHIWIRTGANLQHMDNKLIQAHISGNNKLTKNHAYNMT